MLYSKLKTGAMGIRNNRVLDPKSAQRDGELLNVIVDADKILPGRVQFPPVFYIPELGHQVRDHIAGYTDENGIIDTLAAVSDYTKVRVPLRPPYDVMWVETISHLGFLERWFDKNEPGPKTIGCLVMFGYAGGHAPVIGPDELKSMGGVRPGGSFVRIVPYVPIDGDIISLGAHVILNLNADGTLYCGGTYIAASDASIEDFLANYADHRMDGDGEFLADALREAGTLACLPILRALALLNCKNVSTETTPFARGSKNKRKRRGPLAKAVYHTLVLTLPGKAQTRIGAGTHSESERAFHMVRGHFADYRDGAGLFGRVHGVFWVPAHARGSKDAGVVNKDYSIKQTGKIGLL